MQNTMVLNMSTVTYVREKNHVHYVKADGILYAVKVDTMASSTRGYPNPITYLSMYEEESKTWITCFEILEEAREILWPTIKEAISQKWKNHFANIKAEQERIANYKKDEERRKLMAKCAGMTFYRGKRI